MLTIYAIYTFVVTLCVGSFLNVVIHRLPKMHYRGDDETVYNLNKPASHCPVCTHKIKWYENIPVMSWIILRAKCSSCKTTIHWRYPFLELIAALGSTGIVLLMNLSILSSMLVGLWLMSIPFAWWIFSKPPAWTSLMQKYACFYIVYAAVCVTAYFKLM